MTALGDKIYIKSKKYIAVYISKNTSGCKGCAFGKDKDICNSIQVDCDTFETEEPPQEIIWKEYKPIRRTL